MTLLHRLSQNKPAVLERWLRRIMDVYPADASDFFTRERDRFKNPVGFTTSREIEVLFSELLQDMNRDRLASSLENILKIRAVQNMPPSEAVGFIFVLKDVVKAEMADAGQEAGSVEEYLRLSSRIDGLALMALDIYLKCRERIFEIRLNEAKAERDRLSRLLKRSADAASESADRVHPADAKK
jgi:hypothetical protein